MDAGTLRGIFAVVMLVLFIGIWAWAWSARRRPVFDAAARLPLEPDDRPPARDERDVDATGGHDR